MPAYYVILLPIVGWLLVVVGILHEQSSTLWRGGHLVTPVLGSGSQLPDGPFVFSPLRQRVTFAAMPAGYLIGLIGFFLVAHFKVVRPDQPVSMISVPVAVLVVAVFALPALKPLKRFASVKLILDDEAITIDNPTKSLRVAWEDVASLRWCLVRYGRLGLREVPGLEVEQRGRSVRRTAGFGPFTFEFSPRRPATVPVATYAPSPADQQRLVDQVAIRAALHNVPFSIDMTSPRLRVASYT